MRGCYTEVENNKSNFGIFSQLIPLPLKVKIDHRNILQHCILKKIYIKEYYLNTVIYHPKI